MASEERRRTQLFTLRIWKEPIEQEDREIRIKLQHVLSGEVRYFRDWPAAIDFCTEMLHGCDDTHTAQTL